MGRRRRVGPRACGARGVVGGREATSRSGGAWRTCGRGSDEGAVARAGATVAIVVAAGTISACGDGGGSDAARRSASARSASTDVDPAPDGVVHVFGLEWRDDVGSFAEMVAGRQAQHHGCSAELRDRRTATVAAAPAVAFSQHGCGPEDAAFARLALVHDGDGILAFTSTSPGSEDAAIDELQRSLGGIEWRTR